MRFALACVLALTIISGGVATNIDLASMDLRIEAQAKTTLGRNIVKEPSVINTDEALSDLPQFYNRVTGKELSEVDAVVFDMTGRRILAQLLSCSGLNGDVASALSSFNSRSTSSDFYQWFSVFDEKCTKL